MCKYSQINKYMMSYGNPRSRSFTDLCPRSLRFNILKLFFSKITRPFEANFHMEPPWDVGMKMCSNVLGQMIKMASRPINDKNFKILFRRNQETDDLETWHTASGTQVLPNVSLADTELTLTVFMTWPICFLMLQHVWKLIQHIVIYFQACSAQHILCNQVTDTAPMFLWFCWLL